MIRIYRGTGGGYAVYKIDGDYIYEGTGGGYPIYRIDGNYIYKGTGGGYPVYRIDGNYIYKGTGGGYPVYRIDGNYIYAGTGGGYPVYRVDGGSVHNESEGNSSDTKTSDPSNVSSEQSNASSPGCLAGATVAGCIATPVSILAGIMVGRLTSSFGIGFIVFFGVYTFLCCVVDGIKSHVSDVVLTVIVIAVVLLFMIL